MKKIRFFTVTVLFAVLAFLSSCSNDGAKKFEGEWIPVDDTAFDGSSLVIEEENGAYSYYLKEGDGVKIKKAVFLYDKEKDVLTVTERGEDIDISYNKKKKRMIITNNRYDESFEFLRKK